MNQNLFIAKGINVSCRTIEGSAYIYIEDKKSFLQLNDVGSFIWDAINGTRSVSDIIETCFGSYEGNKSEISVAVTEFLLFLFEEKMIEFSEIKFEGVMADA